MLAGRLGFDETERAKVAIVVDRGRDQPLKHARDGGLIIQGRGVRGESAGSEILALDRGPGMTDVGRCLSDGFSTAGIAGHWPGGDGPPLGPFRYPLRRPSRGRRSVARLWAEPSLEPRLTSTGLDFGAVSLPLAGEEVCGDAWAIDDAHGRSLVLVADGLGHGPPAAEAAREAVRVFRSQRRRDPPRLSARPTPPCWSTRGAALAVALIDRERGEVRFAGVGNISGVILNPADENRRTSMVSHNGTVGHTIRKVQEFIYPWAPGSLLVMHSDGLATQWQVGRYAGLASSHPGLIAGVLYRDFRRSRDDVTVVVVREGGDSR